MRENQHALRRARERFGYTLSLAQLKALNARVRAGVLVGVRGNGREVWRIAGPDGLPVDVIFNPAEDRIVSFLPQATLPEGQRRAKVPTETGAGAITDAIGPPVDGSHGKATSTVGNRPRLA